MTMCWVTKASSAKQLAMISQDTLLHSSGEMLNGLSRQQPQEGALHAFLQLLLSFRHLGFANVGDVLLQVWFNALTLDFQPV